MALAPLHAAFSSSRRGGPGWVGIILAQSGKVGKGTGALDYRGQRRRRRRDGRITRVHVYLITYTVHRDPEHQYHVHACCTIQIAV